KHNLPFKPRWGNDPGKLFATPDLLIRKKGVKEMNQLRCRKMPNTRSRASMTHEEVEELVARRVAEEMKACEAAGNLKTLNENGDEQDGENGGNGNGGNRGNGNGGNGENRNHGMNYGGFMPMARECTFQNFLKCKPHTFSRTEGIVRLTHWVMLQGVPRIKEGWNVTQGITVDSNRQSIFKTSRESIARAYTARSKERKRDYRVAVTSNTQGAVVGNQQGNVCYECGRQRHFRKDCPKLRSQNCGNQTRNKSGNKTSGNEVTTKAYAIGGGGTNPNSNVVTDTFLLNNCYAALLFDLGADRSFVLTTFSALLDVAPSTLDTNLMPIVLGSFDVIIGMDWLVKYYALIVCDKKVICIPYGDKVYLAQVTSKKAEDKLEDKQLEDVPIVRKFPKVFSEDLPRLPLARQVKFQIGLLPSAAPVARALYRLAPAEMQELSTRLQELWC
nr:hypothetical protein [Tanacetum cinerariifolium]